MIIPNSGEKQVGEKNLGKTGKLWISSAKKEGFTTFLLLFLPGSRESGSNYEKIGKCHFSMG